MGRPARYKTSEELQSAIDDYFESGVKTRTVLVGPANNRQAVELEVPTITGLVLHLGFESRQAFYHLENNEKFSYTIKKARTQIENIYEEILQTTGNSGAIFALKNFGWVDKTETDLTSKGEKIEFNLIDGTKS